MARKGINNRGPQGLTTTQSFFGYIELTKRWERNAEPAAIHALEQAIDPVTSDAKATSAYNDVTGATRSGTIAYVQAGSKGVNPIVESARSIAESINPGYTRDEPPPPPELGSVELIAYSPTDYSYHLNIRNAGESMYLADAVLGNSGAIGVAIAEAFADLMRGEQF